MKLTRILITILLTISINLSIINPSNALYTEDLTITGTNGIWTDVRSYISLSDAIAAIGSKQQTLLIPTEVTCSDLTIPSNITLKFVKTGAINNSGTLTIQTTNIIAGHNQIFTGSGSINFADNTEVLASWFSSLYKAINQTSNNKVCLTIDGQYTLSTSISLGNNIILKFSSPVSTISTNSNVTLSNISKVISSKGTIFTGSGDFDFTKGSIIHTSWFTSFRRAITYTFDDNVLETLLLDSDGSLDTDVTINSYTTLKVLKGYTVTIPSGLTLTINGDIDAGNYQIFSGDGNIIFSDNLELKSSWFSSFETAIAKINSAKVNLIVTSPATIFNDCTINDNISLSIPYPNRILTISSEKTLTINGPFSAGLYQVFSGDGSVSFKVASEVWSDWWGNDAVALQKAHDSLPKAGGCIRMSGGIKNHGATSVTIWKKGVVIQGSGLGGQWNVSGADGTTIKYTGSDAAIKFTKDGYNAWGSGLKNIKLDGVSKTPGSIGVKLGNGGGTNVSWWGVLDEVYITGFDTGVLFYGSQGGELRKVHCEHNNIGFHFSGVSGIPNTATHLQSCRAYANSKEGLLIEAGVGLIFTNFITESNGYEGIKIINTLDVSNIVFNGGWTECCQKAEGREDGYYSVYVSGVRWLTLDNFEFAAPINPFNGTTGTKHMLINNSQVFLNNCRSVGSVTAPKFVATGTNNIAFMDLERSIAEWDLSADTKFFPYGKGIFLADSIPTTGNYNKGDIILNSNVNATGGDVFGWICVLSGSPGSWKELGNMRLPRRVVTTSNNPYMVTDRNSIILVDASTKNIVVRLLPAATSTIVGVELTVKKIDSSANVVTVATAIGEDDKIDGATNYTLTTQYNTITIVSDGSNYNIISTH